MSWQENIDNLLFDGERVETAVGADTAQVAITSRRLLVFTPETNEKNYHQVDRPNVESVEFGGDTGYLRYGAEYLCLGALLVLFGRSTDIDATLSGYEFNNIETPVTGVNELIQIGEVLVTLLSWVAQSLVGIGVLFIVGGLLMGRRYLRQRQRRVIIRVSGEDQDIPLPLLTEDNPETVADELKRAMLSEEMATGNLS